MYNRFLINVNKTTRIIKSIQKMRNKKPPRTNKRLNIITKTLKNNGMKKAVFLLWLVCNILL